VTADPSAILARSHWPVVTVAQMREVDRIMVEDLGISLLQMMENAGRATATRARVMVGGSGAGQPVTVLAGPGGNGGGGMAAARKLAVWGAQVTVVLSHAPAELSEAAAQQWAILDKIGVDISTGSALIVDALIGSSLRGAPRGAVAELIHAANNTPAPVLSLDVPSGLDSDTGAAHRPCIAASSTLTLALPKAGLLTPAAAAIVGELFVADILRPRLGV
jgi:NAD(P)H-hydrate epimerase